MFLKDRISSPLEAGPSIFDAHHLPPRLGPALEYASARLARKALHITLVVIRRDYQLPSVIPPLVSPALPTPTTPNSPRFGFTGSPVAALRQLVRSGSVSRPLSLRTDSQQQGVASPLTPMSGLDSPKSRWPASPTTPLSPPPMTPSCTTSSTITDTTGPVSSNSCGFRLIHPAGLSMKDENTLRHTLQRAERRFNLGNEWLSPAVGPAACGLTNHLIHRSIRQNDVLFSSEGMTILTLDRLYSLKAALSAYSKFRSPLRLEDAVDELRRLILTNNGRKVTKADLLRSYDWLSVSHSAVTDLDRMYKRAYGGPEEIGAISGMSVTRTQLVPEPVIRSEDEPGDEGPEEYTIGIALTTQESPKLLVPKAPVLKLQTSFDSPPKKQEDAGDEDGDRTAKPSDWLPIMLQPWNASSIDEVLSPGPGPSPARLGPRTPNGYDDISPTTRGEWGFLMVDDAFQGAKTVTVETC